MSRHIVFTHLDVMSASNKLQEEDRSINGTNLRLVIGKGSPKALMATYQELINQGVIHLHIRTTASVITGEMAIRLRDINKLAEAKRQLVLLLSVRSQEQDDVEYKLLTKKIKIQQEEIVIYILREETMLTKALNQPLFKNQ